MKNIIKECEICKGYETKPVLDVSYTDLEEEIKAVVRFDTEVNPAQFDCQVKKIKQGEDGVYGEWSDNCITVNFCPVCGRKLVNTIQYFKDNIEYKYDECLVNIHSESDVSIDLPDNKDVIDFPIAILNNCDDTVKVYYTEDDELYKEVARVGGGLIQYIEVANEEKSSIIDLIRTLINCN